MSVSLQIENLCKTFTKGAETFTAVHSVNLQVPAGELVTFLGPSGCGKTTILRMVAGFETPTGGKIFIDGQDVTLAPVNSRGIGFVFQNYALFPHMSIFENVAYGLRARKHPPADLKDRVMAGLELVGLPRVEGRFPSQLSGGEQQRVALARVLVLEPQVLLMDEPLSNLDAKLRLHMRTEIRRIQQHLGITCLYVTHDQKEALTLSDRVMVLQRGNVEQIGPPVDLYTAPRTLFVADFIGQANVLPATALAVRETPATGVVMSSMATATNTPTRLADQISASTWEADVTFFDTTLTLRAVAESGPCVTGEVSVILRPENLEPVPAGQGRFPATVRTRFFVGDHMEYDLQLPSGQIIAAFVPCTPDMPLYNPGAAIGVDFPLKSAVVLFAVGAK